MANLPAANCQCPGCQEARLEFLVVVDGRVLCFNCREAQLEGRCLVHGHKGQRDKSIHELRLELLTKLVAGIKSGRIQLSKEEIA